LVQEGDEGKKDESGGVRDSSSLQALLRPWIWGRKWSPFEADYGPDSSELLLSANNHSKFDAEAIHAIAS